MLTRMMMMIDGERVTRTFDQAERKMQKFGVGPEKR